MTLQEALTAIDEAKAAREEKRADGKKAAYRKYAAKNKERRQEYGKAYREVNKEKVREGQYRARRAKPEKYKAIKQRWRAANKDKAREWRLQTQYGLSSAQWEAMFDAQGRCCKICKSKTTNRTGWHTDHDHVTKLVRKILCSDCNRLLGAAKDNCDILAAAIEYLQCHR